VEAEKTRPVKFVKRSTAAAKVFADGYAGTGISAFAADCCGSYSVLGGGDGTAISDLGCNGKETLHEVKLGGAYGGSTFADFSKAFYSMAQYDACPEEKKKVYTRILLKLSNGKQTEDRMDGYWSTHLGTSLYPDLTVSEKIAVYKGGIDFQCSDSTKRYMDMDPDKEELAESVLGLLMARDISDNRKWKFSAKGLADFLASVDHASYSQSMSAWKEKKQREFSLDTRSVDPETQAVFKRRDVQNFLSEIRGSTEEITEIQKLCRGREDLYDVYRLFKEVQFLDSTNPKHVKMVLLLNGGEPEKHKDFLYQSVVQTFAEVFLRRESSAKLASSAAWDSFTDFLKRPVFKGVSEFGSQVTFNTVLKGLGFEHKRIASGKVWVGVEYVTNGAEGLGITMKKNGAEIAEAARLLNVPVPTRCCATAPTTTAPAIVVEEIAAEVAEDNDDALSEEEQIGNEYYYEKHAGGE
jgi:hypothetical protein